MIIVIIISVCVCVYTNTPYCPANIVIYLTLPSNRFAPDRMGVGEYSMDGAGGHLKTLLVNINWVKKNSVNDGECMLMFFLVFGGYTTIVRYIVGSFFYCNRGYGNHYYYLLLLLLIYIYIFKWCFIFRVFNPWNILLEVYGFISVGFEQMVPIAFNQELMNAYDQPWY